MTARRGLRLPERRDAVDPALEQHALLVHLGVAQRVVALVPCVLAPDAVELRGHPGAVRSVLVQLVLHRALDADPVVGVFRIDDQDGDLRILANPTAFRPVRGGIDEDLVGSRSSRLAALLRSPTANCPGCKPSATCLKLAITKSFDIVSLSCGSRVDLDRVSGSFRARSIHGTKRGRRRHW